MATPGSTHINKVLHSYKSQAMNSLHGPGVQELLIEARKITSDDVYGYRYKKAFIYCDPLRKNKHDNTACKICDDDIGPQGEKSAGVLWPSKKTLAENAIRQAGTDHSKVLKPISGFVAPFKTALVAEDANLKNEQSDISPTSEQSHQSAKISVDRSANSAETHEAKTRFNSENTTKSCNSWDESKCFKSSPFDTQPWPVLVSADSDVLPIGPSETLLDGEPIACFNIGGEPRLCFPQILNSVLQSFQLIQINAVCDDLHIYCSRCTPRQLDYLKDTAVLPPTAHSCGLITKTDAMRLIHALLYQHIIRPSPTKLHPTDKQYHTPRIKITHNCFGKGKGLLWSEYYGGPSDACIECLDCRNMYSPEQFVCHAHRNIENWTCHWGFDPENWRCYLLLSRDQPMSQQKAVSELNLFKAKFDFTTTANHKRKQIADSKCDLVKKARSEELQVVTTVNFDPRSSNFINWGPYTPQNEGTWSAVPLITKDGKQICYSSVVVKEGGASTTIPAYNSATRLTLIDGTHVVTSTPEKLERSSPNSTASTPLPPKSTPNKISTPSPTQKELTENAGKGIHPVLLSPSEKTSESLKDSCAIKHETPDEELRKEGLLVRIKSLDEREEVVKEEEFKEEEFVGLSTTSTKTMKSGKCSSPTHGNPKALVRIFKKESCPSSVASTTTETQSSLSNRVACMREVSTPERRELPPDLELSTTDSDTESVASVSSKSEVVEEAEALLRGWNDRAAAKKVLDLFSSVVKVSLLKERQAESAISDKLRLQQSLSCIKREREATPTVSEEELVLREKVSHLERELKQLREQHQRSSPPRIKSEPI